MTQPDANAKYSVEQLADLDDWLKDKFIWRASGKDWLYVGPCFRCGHEVDKLFLEATIFAFREAGETDPELRAMRCNCQAKTHEGAQEKDGCGAWWGLGIEPA